MELEKQRPDRIKSSRTHRPPVWDPFGTDAEGLGVSWGGADVPDQSLRAGMHSKKKQTNNKNTAPPALRNLGPPGRTYEGCLPVPVVPLRHGSPGSRPVPWVPRPHPHPLVGARGGAKVAISMAPVCTLSERAKTHTHALTKGTHKKKGKRVQPTRLTATSPLPLPQPTPITTVITITSPWSSR